MKSTTLPKPRFVQYLSDLAEVLKEATTAQLKQWAGEQDHKAVRHVILQELATRTPKLTITKNYEGEYRVPSPDKTEAGAYYTCCEQDARETARAMHGDVKITIRRK